MDDKKKKSKFREAIEKNLERKDSERKRVMSDSYLDDPKIIKESIVDRQVENQDMEALEEAAKKRKMKRDILKGYRIK